MTGITNPRELLIDYPEAMRPSKVFDALKNNVTVVVRDVNNIVLEYYTTSFRG
jgi:hypothetical protein